jgi:5-methyltetrahydrofolate--homocysteine methyltransferase
MEEICREMTERGMDTPLFVGGATTSAIHTAVKLAPVYGHVFHGADASAAAVMAKKCMMDRDSFEKEQHAQQKNLRLMYERPDPVISSPADTVKIQRNDYATTLLPDDMAAVEVPHEEVMQFFDWKMFYAIWGVKYGSVSPEAMELMQLRRDAEDELALGNFKISLSARYFHAYSDGKDLIMMYPESRRIPMLRQEDRDGMSLCDFVMPESLGMASSCGVFTICVRRKDVHEEGCCCPACSNKYEDLVGKAVRMTLAEAASKWLDKKILDFIHDDSIRIIKPAAGYSSCPDHTLKRDIMELLSGKFDLKIRLTESYAMTPEASICGFIFWHPQAKYHEIRRISREQYEDYALRRGMDENTARRFLGHLLK